MKTRKAGIQNSTLVTQKTEHRQTLRTTDPPVSKVEDEETIDTIRRFDIETKRVHLRQGIYFKGLLYCSPELAALHARHDFAGRVTVRVDKDDLGRIYVLDQKARRGIIVFARAKDYARNLSLHQHEVNLADFRANCSKRPT